MRKIFSVTKSDIHVLIGDAKIIRGLSPKTFVDEQFGAPTVADVLKELEKPGRDPRPEFKTATFQEGVEKISDLRPGMVLEGVVTNVAAFGAFVDIGVHQDGLVHISAMSRTFIKDPREAAKPGDVVKVKVLEVDAARKRIALTMRLDDAFEPQKARSGALSSNAPSRQEPGPRKDAAFRKEPLEPRQRQRFRRGFRAGQCEPGKTAAQIKDEEKKPFPSGHTWFFSSSGGAPPADFRRVCH